MRRQKKLIAIEGCPEDTASFVLLWELMRRYPRAKQIHVVLDNDAIHTARLVQERLATPLGRKRRLHFLPPYGPDHRQIERAWENLYGNVTRSYQYSTMPQLMRNVSSCNRPHNHRRLAAA